MQRKISWEKWKDPLCSVEDWDTVYPPIDGDDDYASVRAAFSDHERPRFNPYKGNFFACPLGIIPLSDHNLPSKTFNFWVMNSNFDLTHRHRRILDRTPGVEVLRILDRYRAWVGIGKLFDEEDVKESIRSALCGGGATPHRSPLASALAKAHPHWAIVDMAEGHRDCVGGATWEEVESKAAGRPIIESSSDKH